MSVLKKLAVYDVIVFLAVFVAGLYGVAYNQVSYTVAPETITVTLSWQVDWSREPEPDQANCPKASRSRP